MRYFEISASWNKTNKNQTYIYTFWKKTRKLTGRIDSAEDIFDDGVPCDFFPLLDRFEYRLILEFEQNGYFGNEIAVWNERPICQSYTLKRSWHKRKLIEKGEKWFFHTFHKSQSFEKRKEANKNHRMIIRIGSKIGECISPLIQLDIAQLIEFVVWKWSSQK